MTVPNFDMFRIILLSACVDVFNAFFIQLRYSAVHPPGFFFRKARVTSAFLFCFMLTKSSWLNYQLKKQKNFAIKI